MKNEKSLFLDSLLVFAFLIVTIIIGNIFLGIRIEILMIFSTAFAGIMAMKQGLSWTDMEKAITERVSGSVSAILIVWTVGIVIAAFMFSGSIPLVIYYGLKLINPQYMYVCSFLICAILSLATGTSWGSAATGGVAMMGIAAGFGIPLHITAAAVICGSLVGDKLSPLSETTNLAPLAAGTDIYKHIKFMLWTSVPATVISLIFFLVLGLDIQTTGDTLPESAMLMINSLDQIYNWNILLILPFALLLGCALLKKPTVPTMLASSLVAILIGGFYQGFDIVNGLNACVRGFTVSLVYAGDVSAEVLTLLNRGGMTSMVGIVIIVYCGYAFAAIVAKAKFIETITAPLISRTETPAKLISATLFTNFFIAACSGSSYAAFIITGEMYKKAYQKQDIDLAALSRTMEDSGTMMLPLVPWSAAGAFFASTLGVEVYGAAGYGIWAVNTYLNPIFAILIAVLGIGIYKNHKVKTK